MDQSDLYKNKNKGDFRIGTFDKHPNEKGHVYIYEKIYSSIISDSVLIKKLENLTFEGVN